MAYEEMPHHTNRQQYVSVNGCQSDTQVIKIVVPQGSVLSPLLFLIYINDLPNSTTNLTSILFTDDTTLFKSHEDINSLCNNMNTELLKAKEQLIANPLTHNAKKTYYIIF